LRQYQHHLLAAKRNRKKERFIKTKDSYKKSADKVSFWHKHGFNFGMWLLRLTVYLPYRRRLGLSRVIGALLYRLNIKRTLIARRNIQVCFPELPKEVQEALVKATMQENTHGLLESAYAWWGDLAPLHQKLQFKNLNILMDLINDKEPVLLIGGHYTGLEITGALVSQVFPMSVSYRANENELYDQVIQTGRAKRGYQGMFERTELRAMVRLLKKNKVLWYAPDQDFGRKESTFAYFFGIPTATLTATSKLAKLTGAKVVPMSYHRIDDDGTYEVEFLPPLEDFPGDDEVQDATRLNQCYETLIKKYPAQYMWVHRRFKTRPDPKDKKFYDFKALKSGE
jgi:KDO2-lipid IV(A) lauroyltransferase